MSEFRKLKNMLILLQQHLSKSGITSKSKWTSFSSSPQMSAAQFTRRLNNLGIPITNKETLSLWKLLKVESKDLNFDGFAKMLTIDPISLAPDPPPPQRALPPSPQMVIHDPPASAAAPLPFVPPMVGLWATLSLNRREFLHKLSASDPLISGRITYANFRSICESFQSADASAVEAVTSIYDAPAKGFFNYFTLLSDICEHSDPTPIPIVRDDYGTGINPDLLRRATYDDLDNECQLPSRAPMLNREMIHQFDSTTRGGGRGKLDPAIFGHRPPVEAPPKVRRLSADEVVGVKPLSGLTVGELLRAIPKFVFKCAKSLKDCYQKWRGMHEWLTAEDLRDGLALDAKVLVPLGEIEALLKCYGGQMTVSAFVRMISDGSKSDVPPTEDEAAINAIAAKLRGEKWAEIVLSSTCVEDIVLGFEQEGIEVSEQEIRLLTSRLGRTGLVSALQARLNK
jgi:hypothetical protein